MAKTNPTSEDMENADLNRSEEHTSELQSHLNLVCRLLLEKKKQHHRRDYRWGIGNNWQTYGAAGRGDAKTFHRRLPCIATILGRSKRRGGSRGCQTVTPLL